MMESKEYKSEKWLELFTIRSENHDLVLYYKGTEDKTVPVIAANKPKPKVEKAQPAPGYDSYDSYASYGGYASYGYASYGGGYAPDFDDYHVSSYVSTITNQAGKEVKIKCDQRDLYGQWTSEPASAIGSIMTAAIIINEQDSVFMGKFFDSVLPSWNRRVQKGAISFIILYDKKNTSEGFALKVANWIGAMSVLSIDKDSLFEHEAAKSFLDSLAKRCAVAQYKPEIVNRFALLEAARFLSLQNIKQTALEVVDPIGNSLLQLAIHNPNPEVFFELAAKVPKLLNQPNIYGQTVIASIGVMKERSDKTTYLDFKRFWALPFDFTNTSINFNGLDLTAYPLLVFDLLRNKEVWTKAKERITDRQNVLDVALQKLPHLFRKKYEWDEELPAALEALELFLAEGKEVTANVETLVNLRIGVDAKGLAMHEFFHNGFLHCVKYFVEKGYSIPEKDVEIAFQIGWPKTIDYLIGTPQFMKLSKETMEVVASHVASKGLNDALRKMAKRGKHKRLDKTECSNLIGVRLPLSANKEALLSSANIIAQANAQKVIPLKHLCVSAMYDTHGEKNIHTAIADAPYDIQTLFINQNRSQWVLYLDSKKKQQRLFKMYEALRNADSEGDAMQVTIDGFMFSFKHHELYSTETVEMWLDGLSRSNNLHYKYSRAEKGITTCSLLDEFWTETHEEHKVVLAKIMDGIGWDRGDEFVLITVLFAHMTGRNAEGKDEIRCKNFVQNSVAANFHPIPDWYKNFILQHYGIEVAPKPHVSS